MPGRQNRLTLVVTVCAATCSPGPAASVVTGTDPDARLPFWEWQSPGMSIRWVQRLPDQTRAFFMARGFNRDQAERIAQSCVFQTVYKNTADASTQTIIEYDLSQWRVLHQGHAQPLKLREAWAAEWLAAKVPAAPRIAFEWSLLPTRQRYQPGDYNWGMSAYDLPPGAVFDLEFSWRQDGQARTGKIEGIRCAPDIQLGPADRLE